jgi:hypothetical protein
MPTETLHFEKCLFRILFFADLPKIIFRRMMNL